MAVFANSSFTFRQIDIQVMRYVRNNVPPQYSHTLALVYDCPEFRTQIELNSNTCRYPSMQYAAGPLDVSLLEYGNPPGYPWC